MAKKKPKKQMTNAAKNKMSKPNTARQTSQKNKAPLKKVKKFNFRRHSWVNPVSIGFILAFTIIGSYYVFKSFAAVPFAAPPRAPARALASSWETSANFVARDEGYSVELPNHKVLWIFGDSQAYCTNTPCKPTRANGSFSVKGTWNGSTAIMGPADKLPISIGTSRSEYVEVYPAKKLANPTLAHPTKFISQPPKTYVPGSKGVACTAGRNYPARWVSGSTMMPGDDSLVLITFMDVCVLRNGPVSYPVEGWGFAMYNWRTNSFEVGPTDVVAPAKDGHSISSAIIYSSPTFASGNLYLFSAQCTGPSVGVCNSGTINASIIPGAAGMGGKKLGNQLAAMTHPGHTHPPVPLFNTGSQGDGGPINPLVSVAKVNKDEGLRLMIQTSTVGNFSVYKAATNNPGNWNLQQTGQVPACSYPQWRGDYCRAFNIHGAYSGSNNLQMTYYDPDAIPLGTNPQTYTGEIVFAPSHTANY